ncbi:MAG: hypothetical protein ABJN40_05945 [Sneathiella sp.]
MEIKVGAWLDCGCCGLYFKTWEGYEDQDQDHGYGICHDCQGDLEVRNREEIDKGVEALRSSLNDENKTRLDAMDYDMKSAIVLKALDEGVLQYKISRR